MCRFQDIVAAILLPLMALPLPPLTPSSSSTTASLLHRLSTPFPPFLSSTTTTIPSSFIPATLRTLRGLLLHGKSSSLIALSSSSAATVEESVQSSEGSRKRLIAQNIPWTCTAEDIRSLFEKHGTVTDVELSMYSSSRNRGLAFITMSSEEEALAALNGLNAYEFDGRIMKVEFARSMKRSPATSITVAPVSQYNVFVGNLTWRVRSSDLRNLFNGSGYLSAEVIYQSNPRRSAGYGFVSFASREEAEAAINKLNGQKLMGRNVRLVLGKVQADNAQEKPQTDK